MNRRAADRSQKLQRSALVKLRQSIPMFRSHYEWSAEFVWRSENRVPVWHFSCAELSYSVLCSATQASAVLAIIFGLDSVCNGSRNGNVESQALAVEQDRRGRGGSRTKSRKWARNKSRGFAATSTSVIFRACRTVFAFADHVPVVLNWKCRCGEREVVRRKAISLSALEVENPAISQPLFLQSL